MNRLIYQVYVGDRSKLYNYCTTSVGDYCKAHDIEHYVQTEPILRIKPNSATSGRSMAASRLGYLPIFEKENAFEWLAHYDQVAIIDADVWIRPGSPNAFDELEDYDFAAVVERDMPLTGRYLQKIRHYSRGQYLPLDDIDWHWNEHGAEFCNMGVMLMNESLTEYLHGEDATEFLQRPEFQRFVDGVGDWKWSTDQTLLNWWLRSEGVNVKHLDWKWNALYAAVRPGMVEEAHFVHFFLHDHLPGRGENVEELAV